MSNMETLIIKGTAELVSVHKPFVGDEGYPPAYLLSIKVDKDKVPDKIAFKETEDGKAVIMTKTAVLSRSGKPNTMPVVVDNEQIRTDKPIYQGSEIAVKVLFIKTGKKNNTLFLKAVKVFKFAEEPAHLGDDDDDEFSVKGEPADFTDF